MIFFFLSFCAVCWLVFSSCGVGVNHPGAAGCLVGRRTRERERSVMSAVAMGMMGTGVRCQRRRSRNWEVSMGKSMVISAVVMLIVLILGSGGLGATAAAPQSSSSRNSGEGAPLIEVTSADHFEELIQSNTDGSVVAFTVSWCGHCKELKPELEAAAVQLAKIGIPVLLADGDRLKKIARRFGVTGFPALFIFPPATPSSSSAGGNTNVSPTRYSGPRTRDGLVRRIKKLLRPETEAVAQEAQMRAFMGRAAAGQTATYLILGEVLPKDKALIERVASSSPLATEIMLGHNPKPDDAMLRASGVERLPALLALYPGHRSPGRAASFVAYSFSEAVIEQFVRETMLPPVLEIDAENTGILIESGLLPVLVFTKGTKEEDTRVMDDMRELAISSFKRSHQIAHLDCRPRDPDDDTSTALPAIARLVDLFRVTSFPQVIAYNHAERSFVRCPPIFDSIGEIENPIRRCLDTQLASYIGSIDDAEIRASLITLVSTTQKQADVLRKTSHTELKNMLEKKKYDIEYLDTGFFAWLDRKYPFLIKMAKRPEFMLLTMLPITIMLSYFMPSSRPEEQDAADAATGEKKNDGDGQSREQQHDDDDVEPQAEEENEEEKKDK